MSVTNSDRMKLVMDVSTVCLRIISNFSRLSIILNLDNNTAKGGYLGIYLTTFVGGFPSWPKKAPQSPMDYTTIKSSTAEIYLKLACSTDFQPFQEKEVASVSTSATLLVDFLAGRSFLCRNQWLTPLSRALPLWVVSWMRSLESF